MHQSIKPIIVTSDEELEHIYELLAHESVIAVDTEFVREQSYYPVLCLLQIATSQEVIFIDPLINNLDLTKIWSILMRDDLIKVIHSGRQDVEIIYKAYQRIPPNIFDTQIAVQFLGIDDILSYEALVKLYLNQTIDKSSQRSNWMVRPLTPKQIQYAAADVFLLRQIYFIVNEKLAALNRLDWLMQEIDIAYDPSVYIPNINRLLKQLGPFERSFTVRQNRQAYRLVCAREEMAQINNVTRQNILTSDHIKTLCRHPVLTLQIIEMTCSHLLPNDQVKLWNYYEQSPLPERNFEPEAYRKERNDEILQYLHLCIKAISVKHQIAASLIMTNLNLMQFIDDNKPGTVTATGWRYELLGDLITQIMASQAGLYVKDRTLLVQT